MRSAGQGSPSIKQSLTWTAFSTHSNEVGVDIRVLAMRIIKDMNILCTGVEVSTAGIQRALISPGRLHSQTSNGQVMT
jgi:hypothetical protein